MHAHLLPRCAMPGDGPLGEAGVAHDVIAAGARKRAARHVRAAAHPALESAVSERLHDHRSFDPVADACGIKALGTVGIKVFDDEVLGSNPRRDADRNHEAGCGLSEGVELFCGVDAPVVPRATCRTARSQSAVGAGDGAARVRLRCRVVRQCLLVIGLSDAGERGICIHAQNGIV